MNYIDFRKKLVADDDFAKKFAGCKTPADLIKAAAAEGFTFTEDDIKNNTELLPEELEKSAGGGKGGIWHVAVTFWLICDFDY